MSAYDPGDPATWTHRQQVGFMSGSLNDFLDTVPTARAAWSASPEEIAERTAEKDRISAAMDAVYKAMDEP